MSSEFVSIMDKIGHDIKVVWGDVVRYLPAAEGLAALLFPANATVPVVIDSVNLIQQAVATVEQKFAAAGEPTGTSAQKAAQVISIVGPAVTSLLASEKISINQTQLNKIINAVVAVLNVQAAPAS